MLKKICILIEAAIILDIPMIWCQQCPHALGPSVPLVAEFLRKSDPVNKSSFGRCGDQWLTEQLRQRNRLRLMLCSIETYVCTYLVALDLLRYDCEVHVIADAVSSRTAENKQIGISRMQHGGAKASSTEMALFELARDATHPKFKQIAKLIKH